MRKSLVCSFFGATLGLTATAAFATDYDGDGLDDMAFYRPGGTWGSVPIVFSNGDGTWGATNESAPRWAHQLGVIAVSGDYDGDGTDDVAFHQQGGTWSSVPVLFSNGDGTWRATNQSAPTWAHQLGVIAVSGDYDGDGRDDIAFHKPGGTWRTVPVVFSNGDGSWYATNRSAATWAHESGVIAVSGDYNGDGSDDIAFHKPGGTWNTIPIVFSNGNGTWNATNQSAPTWAHLLSVIAVGGDYDGDGRDDIAFHKPGGTWGSVPVVFSNGDGTWDATNRSAPTWAHQLGVIAVSGDYNADDKDDIAFHKPGGSWSSIPVIFSNGDGAWNATNRSAPTWAHQLGVIAVSGDYNGDDQDDIAFHKPGGTWSTIPVVFSNGNGTWNASNPSAPTWAHQLGVRAAR